MATHISDHIHEWRRHRRLIKFWIPDQLLTDWFTTSFVPAITRDIAMGACVTEEQVIARAQYLDLVYSQSGTLYDYLPDAPRPGTSKPPPKPSVYDVIGSIRQSSKKSSTNSGKQMLLRVSLVLGTLPRLILSSPPWQKNPRKGKRKGSQRKI